MGRTPHDVVAPSPTLAPFLNDCAYSAETRCDGSAEKASPTPNTTMSYSSPNPFAGLCSRKNFGPQRAEFNLALAEHSRANMPIERIVVKHLAHWHPKFSKANHCCMTAR